MCPEGYNHQAVVDFETNIISIHMPMRGTTNTRSGRRPLPHFNPRAHEGHDSKEYIRLIFVYNSTAQFGTLEQTIIQ